MSERPVSVEKSLSFFGYLANIYRKIFQVVFRMVPYPTKPRLIRIGNPDRNSPVLVTGNYDLTVRRVCRALRDTDCYLLVARCGGIDVWCAAGGGLFNVDSILSILKTSGIATLVDHRRLLLSQLCANSIDLLELQRRTGWTGIFGPMWAKHVPEYLETRSKSEEMLRVTFTLPERLEMATAMWGSVSLRYTWIPCVIFGWSAGPWFMLAVGLFALAVNLGCFVLPGKTFVQKVGLLGLLSLIGLVAWTASTGSATAFGILQLTLIIGFSSFLIGTFFPSYSPYWPCSYSSFFYGSCDEKPALVEDDCIDCGICNWICPVKCFSQENGKVRLAEPERCLECGACVLQCPTEAIVQGAACS